ncbi:unnamed protein product [Cochlearia groenlandica]
MGDSENAQQTSKKRGALKQLTRENPDLDDEDDSVEMDGTFKKATDEVLASRRIVRVKRKEPSAAAAPPAATANPFAGIRLVSSTAPAAVAPAEAVVEDNQKEVDTEEEDEVDSKKVVVKDSAVEETEKAKDDDVKTTDDAGVDKTVSGVADISNNAVEETDQTDETLEKKGSGEAEENKKDGDESGEADKNNGDNNNGSLSSFQQHSSIKNAFTGLASTEASASSFSFGSVSQDGSTGSLFGNNTSLFAASGSSITKKSEASGFPPKQEVSTETGEENEKVAFSADSIMFEYLEGAWKERGKGELKVNVSGNDGGKARLVMRAKGNYRLILNASLYPGMKLAAMDKKGITFACVNSVSEGNKEGGGGLSTFALKFKDPMIVDEFRVAIDKHKDSKPVETAPLKTPENSPTATDA